MSGRKKRKAKKLKIELPNLTDIYCAFTDARALVTVACDFITQNNDPGPAVSVLILSVEALDRVSEQLEEAEIQFDRFRRKKDSAGGAS